MPPSISSIVYCLSPFPFPRTAPGLFTSLLPDGVLYRSSRTRGALSVGVSGTPSPLCSHLESSQCTDAPLQLLLLARQTSATLPYSLPTRVPVFFLFFFVPALSSLPNDLGLEYRFPVLDVDLLVRRLCGELCLRVPRMLALLRSTAFAFPLKRGSFSYRARSFRVYCEISCL